MLDLKTLNEGFDAYTKRLTEGNNFYDLLDSTDAYINPATAIDLFEKAVAGEIEIDEYGHDVDWFTEHFYSTVEWLLEADDNDFLSNYPEAIEEAKKEIDILDSYGYYKPYLHKWLKEVYQRYRDLTNKSKNESVSRKRRKRMDESIIDSNIEYIYTLIIDNQEEAIDLCKSLRDSGYSCKLDDDNFGSENYLTIWTTNINNIEEAKKIDQDIKSIVGLNESVKNVSRKRLSESMKDANKAEKELYNFLDKWIKKYSESLDMETLSDIYYGAQDHEWSFDESLSTDLELTESLSSLVQETLRSALIANLRGIIDDQEFDEDGMDYDELYEISSRLEDGTASDADWIEAIEQMSRY